MATFTLAEEVAKKIKALPNEKRDEVLKSIESFVAEATRELPRKYTGATWADEASNGEFHEPRPNVWRFTAGPHPNPFG